MRILIVEDEVTLNKTIAEGLQEFGYQTDSSENFKDAEYYIGIRNYDLVLTDWMLQDGDGVDLINIIKHKSPRTSVVVLSAKDDKESEIKALRAGADDYIKKPFDFDILVARLEARLRFGGTNIIKIDELIINPDEEKITYLGRDIVSKEQLLDAIWEEPELVTPNVIEVAINQIRQKMDKPLNISTIETVRRRGYRFCFPKKA